MNDLCTSWIVAAALAAGSAAPPARPPASTAPAAAATAPAAREAEPDPAAAARALLARFHDAAGGAAWDAVRALHTTGTATTGGLDGTFETWEDLARGLGSSRFQLGPLSGAEGFDGDAPWSQDPSGEVTAQRGEEALEAARDSAYRTALGWWYPERWPATLRLLPSQREGERSFAVVEITPRGGRPFELWLDEASALPDRVLERGGVLTTTTFLAGWRRVETARPGAPSAPVLLPFRARISTGESKYDLLLSADSVEVDPPVPAGAFSPPPRRAGDSAIAAGASATRVPIALRSNHVYVDVALDGHGPLTMMLDTGGFNVVTPETAKELGLESQGALQARGVGEGSEDLALTHLGEVRLGDVTLRDQLFFVLPMDGLAEAEGTEVAGVLGFELLQRFVTEIDYAARRLTLTLPERFDPSGAGTSVPFVFVDHMPAVDGSVDGIAGRFAIDTGSRSALALHGPFVDKHGLVARYRPEIETVTGFGVGGDVRARVTRAGMLRLGEVEVPEPVTELVISEKGALADRYLAGNVGGGVLRRFRVTLDYRHERLYLAPGGDAGPDSFDRAGLWLVQAGGALAVEDVVPGGPAAAAGVRPGDRLESVDGVALDKLDLAEVLSRLRYGAPGTRVRLRMLGGGESRIVEVELAELAAQPAAVTPAGQETPVPPSPQ
jgi:hypothetical protein